MFKLYFVQGYTSLSLSISFSNQQCDSYPKDFLGRKIMIQLKNSTTCLHHRMLISPQIVEDISILLIQARLSNAN